RLRWSTSQARVSFEQLGTDVSCYGFSCYGFLSSPTWVGMGRLAPWRRETQTQQEHSREATADWALMTSIHRHRLLLLRTRRERPCRRRAAEQRDERASFHSMTSSARASSIAGISRPSALAVLRLMTNSNLTDCTIGKSAALSPFKMRPTLMPACR